MLFCECGDQIQHKYTAIKGDIAFTSTQPNYADGFIAINGSIFCYFSLSLLLNCNHFMFDAMQCGFDAIKVI